jgi:ribosomal protein L24E
MTCPTTEEGMFKMPKPTKLRTCWYCKGKVYVSQAYKVYRQKDGLISITLCSKKCYYKYLRSRNDYVIKRYGMGYFDYLHKLKEDGKLQEVCSIVKQHDEELKGDPERIDIGKFLRVYIPCVHEKNGKKEMDDAEKNMRMLFGG